MNHPHPGLPYPAKLAKKTLRIVALGGLGEIGRNMTVFEYEGRLLIVDCGGVWNNDESLLWLYNGIFLIWLLFDLNIFGFNSNDEEGEEEL